mgnify:CR=1 FL=1
MELKNYPNDFASAYADNHFSFAEVDPANPTDVVFYDAKGDIVALRRYVGRESFESSPNTLLCRLLSPEPLAKVSECGFVRPEGRDALLSVEYSDGEKVTPQILFTSSHYNHSANTVMGGVEQWRTIASGECDEVAFCVASGVTLSASLWVDGAMMTTIGSYTAPTKGVVLFEVAADNLLSRLRNPENVSECDLRFDINGVECAMLHYRWRSACRSDVRVAWLNTEGGISYHTFRLANKTIHRSSKECDTLLGRQMMSVESWIESVLLSEVLSSVEARALSEILTSPRLWICSDEGFEPQVILSHKLLLEGDGVRRMTLTIRPAKSQCFSV